MPGPYPLQTLAPTVGPNGIAALSYADILSSIEAAYQGIYGADVYLGSDSQDGEWLAIIAQAIFDCGQACVFVYNQFSPATSQGTGLSSVVKINGLRRELGSYSTVDLVLVGVFGTPIQAGALVGDNQNLGTTWAINENVTIPASGTITVGATCQQEGAVQAAAGTLVIVLTPTPGWINYAGAVTNPVAATPGFPVETDAQLRQRQTISTALPAETVLDAIVGNVAAVPGVLRVIGFENATSATNAYGMPPHAIAIVADGGDPIQIATAIALKKPPGIPTAGNITEVILDSQGVPANINFYALSVHQLYVLFTLQPQTGYASNTGTLAAAAIAYFVNTLDIGENSFLSRLFGPAGLTGDAATNSSGLSQSQLDDLSSTFSIPMPLGIAQARDDMAVIGGPYGTGATAAVVQNPASFSAGQTIFLQLSGGGLFGPAIVTGVTRNTVSFAPALGFGQTVSIGALIFIVGDVQVFFNEALACAPRNITLMTAPGQPSGAGGEATVPETYIDLNNNNGATLPTVGTFDGQRIGYKDNLYKASPANPLTIGGNIDSGNTGNVFVMTVAGSSVEFVWDLAAGTWRIF